MLESLETSAGDIRGMLLRAAEIVEQYYAGLREMPVMPVASSSALREAIGEPLPEYGTRLDNVLAIVRDVVYPMNRHNAHPRSFGYVTSPGTAAAVVGDLLVSGLNANVTSFRSAPAGAELEHLVIDWLKSMIGFSSGAAGLLVSGGSMANLSGLAAARSAADPEIGRLGSRGNRPALRIYASAETHFSIEKAARILGIGSENVRSIPTGNGFRIDVAELERAIAQDRDAGFRPMCIVANAGTVASGAFDPIARLADIAAREGIWLHVDGAYGAMAALAPSARHHFAGIERADSLALDPHKWLYGSMGCGCILYRDSRWAMAAFGQSAEYTRPLGLSRDEAFVFWDLGPELSRPFRALTIWMQIKLYGARALSAAVEKNLECARYFATLVERSDDFELLAPVELSIFCFRYNPASYTGDLDALNERVLVELQRGGSSYLSNARIRGQFALRGCVLNYRTTFDDMERLFADVRQVAEAVAGS